MWILSSKYPKLKTDQNVILTGNIIKCYFLQISFIAMSHRYQTETLNF